MGSVGERIEGDLLEGVFDGLGVSVVVVGMVRGISDRVESDLLEGVFDRFRRHCVICEWQEGENGL
jgi:hypothetical protein